MRTPVNSYTALKTPIRPQLVKIVMYLGRSVHSMFRERSNSNSIA